MPRDLRVPHSCLHRRVQPSCQMGPRLVKGPPKNVAQRPLGQFGGEAWLRVLHCGTTGRPLLLAQSAPDPLPHFDS
eukprot:11010178-Alexandrium_andersonii.AAC.1